jgi:hypothetical protein
MGVPFYSNKDIEKAETNKFLLFFIVPSVTTGVNKEK